MTLPTAAAADSQPTTITSTATEARDRGRSGGDTTGLTTRFAPAPTGLLHLGHLANALFVWGVARARSADVVLRIEDHDRQRCRPEHEAALLDDLDGLGLVADRPSTDELRAGASEYRQSDSRDVYAAALTKLDDEGRVYACDCSRSTFAAWERTSGRPWLGPGCPGRCVERRLARRAGTTLRVALGDGEETWQDAALGARSGRVALAGDLPIRDRHGNWTYGLCVVVDDMRHGIDLVIRGEDLLEATPVQIRLGRVLGRHEPPVFLHHPLIRRPDGAKLSKADGDTAVRSLLDAGRTPADLLGEAAAAVGLVPTARPLSVADAATLFA